jgi:hypothetical protein
MSAAAECAVNGYVPGPRARVPQHLGRHDGEVRTHRGGVVLTYCAICVPVANHTPGFDFM